MPKGSYNRGKGKAIAWLRAHVGHSGDDCLIFPFTQDRDGYGMFGFEGRVLKAHRWMCEAANGPAPSAEHLAAHECGNGHLGCVHPKHLQWKTEAENAVDRIKHGNTYCGKGRSLRKLSHEQVLKILALKGIRKPTEIATEFGVSNRQIRLIHQGKSWRGGVPRKTGCGEVNFRMTAPSPLKD